MEISTNQLSAKYKSTSHLSNDKFELILYNHSNKKRHKLKINKNENNIEFISISYDKNGNFINNISSKLDIDTINYPKIAQNINPLIKNIATNTQVKHLITSVKNLMFAV